MKSRILTVALLTLTLAACSDSADKAGTAAGAATASGAGPSSVGSAASGSASASAGSGPSAGPQSDPSSTANTGGDLTAMSTLVTFTRKGGLSGANDALAVLPDGHYMVQTRQGSKNGKLSAEELSALKAALASVDFNKLPSANDAGAVADGYTYTVTYGGRQITAKDGAIPPALQPVINALGGFLSK